MNLHSPLQAIALATLVTLPLYAQTDTKSTPPLLTTAAPETAGFNPERLNRIDGLIQSYIDKGAFPGVAALVVRDGKIVYYKAFGKSDLEANKPMAKDAIFRIASMTKAITSLAVMMLHEEGKIMFDDPISKYIPEFAKPVVLDKFNDKDSTYTTVPAKKEITIRQLLSHMSGINYNVIASDPHMRILYTKAGIPDAFTTENIKLGDIIKKLAKQPLNHQPGEKWTYGLSIDVLGYLVEVVSGMPLDQFFQTRIFEPLGMKDTYFYLPDSKKDRLVALYSEDKDKKLVKTATIKSLPTNPDFPITGAKSYFSGGGGLSSTAYDYAIFLQMLLNNGVYNGKRLLSRKGVDLFTNANQSGTLFPNSGSYFSLGFEVINEKGHSQDLNSVGTFSWGGAFSTHYFADPKEKICVLLMKQMWGTTYGSELDKKFDVLVYQALDE